MLPDCMVIGFPMLQAPLFMGPPCPLCVSHHYHTFPVVCIEWMAYVLNSFCLASLASLCPTYTDYNCG